MYSQIEYNLAKFIRGLYERDADTLNHLVDSGLNFSNINNAIYLHEYQYDISSQLLNADSDYLCVIHGHDYSPELNQMIVYTTLFTTKEDELLERVYFLVLRYDVIDDELVDTLIDLVELDH